MMKQVMKRAWELAKQGVTTFGGKVREYFASSLSIAWEEIKGMNKSIITFTKDIKGNVVEFEVIATKNNQIKVIANGFESIARIKEVGNAWAYIVGGKMAKMMYDLAGMKAKPEAALIHESAETAKEKVSAYVDAYQVDKYKNMAATAPITFSKFYNDVTISAGNSTYFANLCKKIGQVKWQEYIKENGKVDYDMELSVTYSLTRNQMDDFLDWVDAQLAEKETAQANAVKQEEKRIATLIEKARVTGEKQIVRSWSEECNCIDLDCDVDNIHELIDENGKITTERVHTY